MIKRWKGLDELPCVNSFGIRHKIAHFIGIERIALCISAYFAEGLRKGLTKEGG